MSSLEGQDHRHLSPFSYLGVANSLLYHLTSSPPRAGFLSPARKYISNGVDFNISKRDICAIDNHQSSKPGESQRSLVSPLHPCRITTGGFKGKRWTGLNGPEGWQLSQGAQRKAPNQFSGGQGRGRSQQPEDRRRPTPVAGPDWKVSLMPI